MTKYRGNSDGSVPVGANRQFTDTDSLRVTNRYEKDGETWLVVSNVAGPFLEIDVRERDLAVVEG